MPSCLRHVLVVDPGLVAVCDYDTGFMEIDGDFTASRPGLHGQQPAPRRASAGAWTGSGSRHNVAESRGMFAERA